MTPNNSFKKNCHEDDFEKSMRKLIIAEQISLDGVIQSPGAPEEDPGGDFREIFAAHWPRVRRRNR